MPIGIFNTTNVSLEEIIDIANVSSVPAFFVNVNNTVYGGVLFFIMLFVLWIILVVIGYKVSDQLMNTLMYSGAVVSVMAFLLRGLSLLTDFQLWVFPVITLVLAMIVWATRD